MRKKSIKALIIILLSIIAAFLIWNLFDGATAFVGGQTAELSYVDSLYLRYLLTMKETDFIEYGCGFSENCSVHINGLTYCLAQDDCNSIYIKELDFYYIIFEGNHEKLHELLAQYQ